MEKTQVAPRIALAPDGEVRFFDEKGERITPKEISREELIATLNEKKLQHYQTISLFSMKGSDCKVIIDLGYVVYCFIVDCITGEFRGLC